MKTKPSKKADWIRAALDRYERPLLRYTAHILGDRELARDVVQETFLRLCRAKRSTVQNHLAPWLYTVARNHALNVRKKEARMYRLQKEEAQSLAGGATAGAVELDETRSFVLEALGELPENQQEACRLKFQDELTYREISQVMGISLGTVSNLITTALNSVRQQLRARPDLAQEA